jgi:hypothetical protein
MKIEQTKIDNNPKKADKNRGKIPLSLMPKKQGWIMIFLVLAAFFSWSAWGIVAKNASPKLSTFVALPLFYISLFFALATTFSLVITLLVSAFSPNRPIVYITNTAIRQGIIMAAIVIIALVFQQYRILTWWVLSLLLTMGFLIEISFIDKK